MSQHRNAAERATGRTAEIVAAALHLLETEGPAAVTMRRVASALGIKEPSLYKHVADKNVIIGMLQRHAMTEFGTAVATAGPSPHAVAAAFRAWALGNPHLYELATHRPLRRDIVEGAEAHAGAPLAAAVGGNPDRMRAFLGLAHGLVDLELNGHFDNETDLDAAWEFAVDAFERAARPRNRGTGARPTPVPRRGSGSADAGG